MTPETKLWYDFKKHNTDLILNRIENTAGNGMPDVLFFNKNNHFGTVEMKAIKANKIKFQPMQIAWHHQHPHNTFILVRALGQGCLKLFPGSMIHELVTDGFGSGSVVPEPWSQVLARLSAC